MAKTKVDDANRKILSAWDPPPGAGAPEGCVATTFTFQPEFFEEHCLSRFLSLETDPREGGADYLLEREEKLATTRVSVLVDRSNAAASPSARWDVLSVSIPRSILHAKVAVLAWHNWIRVIIASANLTEQAYRKNQEVFGVLDFHEELSVPAEVLDQIIDFLRAVARLTPGADSPPGPRARLLGFLDGLRTTARRWRNERTSSREWPRIVPVLLGPMNGFDTPIPERLGRLVRERGGPASRAEVLSPFYDKDTGSTYRPTEALVAALSERGERHLGFLVPGEHLPDERVRLAAPRSLVSVGRKTAEVAVYPVLEEVDRERRPLHAKSIWLRSEGWHVYMIGSSNFTTAGLGLVRRGSNIEANLAYVFPNEPALKRMMEATHPDWEDPLEDLDAALWEPIDELEGEGVSGAAVLPLGFEEALFEPAESGGTFRLRLTAPLPSSWTISLNQRALYSETRWLADGHPAPASVPCDAAAAPRSLDVAWVDENGHRQTAAWPVNVTDPSLLAPPDELRKLPLESLIEILASGLPIHEAIQKVRRRMRSPVGGPPGEPDPELDPLRRVRSETFLLQRTRRVAKALEQLVQRLSSPVTHADALAWRLRGPVGPLALARALVNEARSSGECCFLLAEVLLALGRVRVSKISHGLRPEHVRREISAVKGEIAAILREKLSDDRVAPSLVDYVEQALEKQAS